MADVVSAYLWRKVLPPEVLDAVDQLDLVPRLALALQIPLQSRPDHLYRVQIRALRWCVPPIDIVVSHVLLGNTQSIFWVVLHKSMPTWVHSPNEWGEAVCQYGINIKSRVHSSFEHKNPCRSSGRNPAPHVHLGGMFHGGFGAPLDPSLVLVIKALRCVGK